MWLLHNETFQTIVLLELLEVGDVFVPDLDGKPQRADYRRLIDLFFPVNFTDDPNKIGKTYDGITYREGNTYDESQEFIQKLRNLKPRN